MSRTRSNRRAGSARAGTPRRRAAVVAAVLAALALPCSQAALAQGKTRVGFWAGEAVTGTDWNSPDTYWNRRDTSTYTPYLWSVLRRYRIPLYLNLRYRRDFGPVPPGKPHRGDGLAIVRKANRLGVPVWGWILIPYEDGYWAWEGAAAEQFDAAKALVRWTRAKHVRLQGLALDPESRLNTPFETTAATLGGGSDAGLPSLFQPAIDPAGQCSAWRGYSQIPRWAKRHHISVLAAPMPAALDDLGDGRLALQDAADFILPRAPWSELFFQAYRSVFAYYVGHDPGPGIVSSYLRSAQREFGSVGQVSLGVSGSSGYRHLSSLVHDVRLAATLGARDVPIYSLEKTLKAYGGPRALAQLAQAATHPFTGAERAKATAPTAQAKTLRKAISRSDAAAVTATSMTTDSLGTPLLPNPWPNGCGG